MVKAVIISDPAAEFKTIHVRHFDIGDDQGKLIRMFLEPVPGYQAILSRYALAFIIIDIFFQLGAEKIRIFDQQNFFDLRRSIGAVGNILVLCLFLALLFFLQPFKPVRLEGFDEFVNIDYQGGLLLDDG